MLKYIFFFFGIIALMYELWVMCNLKKLFNFRKAVQDNLGDQKSIGLPLLKILPEKACLFVICHILYFLWSLVGLFSSQWLIFLVLTPISFISGKLLPRNIGFEAFSTIVFIDSFISAGLVGFAIINAIHLHIPLFSYLIDLFK